MSQLNWQPGMTLASLERAAIQQALRFYQGNKETAAVALGIPISQLTDRIAAYQTADTEQERIAHEQRKQREEFLQRSRGAQPAKAIPAGGTSISSADAGVPVESASVASQEQTMPVSERTEVQGVLPRKAAEGRPRKYRR